MHINMWYGHKFEKGKYGANANFNDLAGTYYGLIYNEKGKIIGDFTCDDSTTISEYFNIKWNS